MASKGLELIKTISERALKRGGYEQCIKSIKYMSAGDGHCKAEFTVGNEHVNPFGTLHGGCTSTIVDVISTYALMTKDNSHPGVSVDLHVTFLKSASIGETLIVDAKAIKVGKRLAFLEVELTKKEDGVIVARGQHTKFIKS